MDASSSAAKLQQQIK